MEHCWVELQEDISDSEISQFDIRFGFSTILLVLVGVPLNLAIVHHEWYGEGKLLFCSKINVKIALIFLVKKALPELNKL